MTWVIFWHMVSYCTCAINFVLYNSGIKKCALNLSGFLTTIAKTAYFLFIFRETTSDVDEVTPAPVKSVTSPKTEEPSFSFFNAAPLDMRKLLETISFDKEIEDKPKPTEKNGSSDPLLWSDIGNSLYHIFVLFI